MDARQKDRIEGGKLAQIEADFVAAKESGGADRQLRVKLEKARREYREKWRIPPKGTSVQPATVKASADVKEVGA